MKHTLATRYIMVTKFMLTKSMFNKPPFILRLLQQPVLFCLFS